MWEKRQQYKNKTKNLNSVYHPPLKKRKKIWFQVSGVRCEVSYVVCRLLPVLCQKWKQPQPRTLPLLNPPLCTAGWLAKSEKSIFFCVVISYHFWAKMANSETKSLFQYFLCRDFFLYLTICPKTFVNGSNRTLKIQNMVCLCLFMDVATYRLNQPRVQLSKSSQTVLENFLLSIF